MANYVMQCDAPGEAIEQICNLNNKLVAVQEQVKDFTKFLGDRQDKCGKAIGDILREAVVMGKDDGALILGVKSLRMNLMNNVLFPAYDLYYAETGRPHENDNRELD